MLLRVLFVLSVSALGAQAFAQNITEADFRREFPELQNYHRPMVIKRSIKECVIKTSFQILSPTKGSPMETIVPLSSKLFSVVVNGAEFNISKTQASQGGEEIEIHQTTRVVSTNKRGSVVVETVTGNTRQDIFVAGKRQSQSTESVSRETWYRIEGNKKFTVKTLSSGTLLPDKGEEMVTTQLTDKRKRIVFSMSKPFQARVNGLEVHYTGSITECVETELD